MAAIIFRSAINMGFSNDRTNTPCIVFLPVFTRFCPHTHTRAAMFALQCLIMVVDSTDHERIGVAREEL